MSIKDIFGKSSGKILTSQQIEDLYEQAESSGLIEEIAKDNERYLPPVNFYTASNFARYGSAEKYYVDAIKNIYQNYPYDGSKKEKQEWRNNSTQLDLFVFDNIYPRTTGYIALSGSDVGPIIPGSFLATASNYTYIEFVGGPNNPTDTKFIKDAFNGSNIFDPSKNRGSNLDINPNNYGNTIEFWAKLDSNVTLGGNIFNVWNGVNFYDPIVAEDINNFALLSVSLTTDQLWIQVRDLNLDVYFPGDYDAFSWNHYAVVIQPRIREDNTETADLLVYINGKLFFTHQDVPVQGKKTYNTLKARIGCWQSFFDSELYNQEYDKKFCFIGQIDEFRFWKEARTSQEISRNWFMPVGGGSNTDDSNTELGVYYKFNEGIVGDSALDSKVLDYSGRVTNGKIINYKNSTRSTGSAIDEYFDELGKEYKDPILYSSHQSIIDVMDKYSEIGKEWDNNNNSSIIKSLPSWLLEEQEKENSEDLNNLTQIISSYFDTLHLQIENLPKLRENKYYTQNDKQIPFIDKILSSYNFDNLDIFTNTSFIEEILSRNEDKQFSKTLLDVKNGIYQNIYNNLSYIYKSKGTEKALRNLIRCFGVDDELIKINLYANNTEYKISNGYNFSTIEKRFVDFNKVGRFDAFVCGKSIPASSDDVEGYGTLYSTNDYDYIPLTLQAEVLFPKKIENEQSQLTEFTTVSLFGLHEASGESTLDWGSDRIGLSVLAQKRDETSKDVYFILKGNFRDTSLTNHSFEITSSWFKNVYENEKWNLALRVKHEKYGNTNISSGDTEGDYIVELYGVNAVADEIQNEFKLTTKISSSYAKNGLRQNKRVYLGAHYENNDLSYLLQFSDVKISSVRYWYDYLSDNEIKSHALDASSIGREYPTWDAYTNDPINGILGISKIDTLALNWEFNLVTGSNSSGEFFVEDSSDHKQFSYSDLSTKLRRRHTGLGINFPDDDDQVVNKEYIYCAKQQNPESVSTTELIQIRNEDDVNQVMSSKPLTYFYSIEKSMYQVMNDQMLKWMATINSFNNLIGEPLEKYRYEYKSLNYLRSLFFEQVGNTPDFERFLEFYKWIDSSISLMIQQLIPASANVSENVRNIIESHIFERNKYQNKLPTIEKRKEKIYDSIYSNLTNFSEQRSVNGSRWLKQRLERNDPLITSGDPGVDSNREEIRNVIGNRNLNSIPRGFDFVDESFYNSRKDQTRMMTDITKISAQKLINPEKILNTINISNNLIDSSPKPINYLTGSGQILSKIPKVQNYLNKYEYFQSSGRSKNNLKLLNIKDQINLSSSSPYFTDVNDRLLPNRPVVKTIFVERFSSPGGPEVNGRGALDAESEEFSVYNGINNRNLNVRTELNKWSAESASYNSEYPSYHKVNKNTGYRIVSGGIKPEYNNLYITHQIPRSDSQYAWITASLLTKPSSSGFYSNFENVSIYNSDTAKYLSGTVDTDFLGLNINSDTLSAVDTGSMTVTINSSSLNSSLLNINGPYQGAGWKQNFKNYNKIIRDTRKDNKILIQDLPTVVESKNKRGFPVRTPQRKSPKFTAYVEPPIEFNIPMTHTVDFPGSRKNIILNSTYDNNKNKLANKKLVKRLSIKTRKDKQTHDNLLELQNSNFIQKPNIVKAQYTQQILPRKELTGIKNVRIRPNYEYTSYTGSVVKERSFWRDDAINRARKEYSDSLYEVGYNTFSLVNTSSFVAYNNSPTCSIYSNINESILAVDAIYSVSTSVTSGVSNKLFYNDFVRGNLYKNTLMEEKSNILLDINYETDNIGIYDVKTRNIYNLNKSVDFMQIFSGSAEVNCFLSASSGIYIAGDFTSSYGRDIVLWNGSQILPLSGTFPGSSIKSLVSGSNSLWAVDGTNNLYRWNNNSWNTINISRFNSINDLITSSNGVILAGYDNGSGSVVVYNGTTSYTVGTGIGNAVATKIISGSDGIYVGSNYNTDSVIIFTGSLASSNSDTWLRISSGVDGPSKTVSALFSSSNGLYASTGIDGQRTGSIYNYYNSAWENLGTFSDNIKSISSSSNGLYIGGVFDFSGSNRMNGVAVYNRSWGILGRSPKRSGFLFNANEKVNCVLATDKTVYFGGKFNSFRSGPLIKDGKNIYKNIVEGNNISNNMLIPHPQLVFNNFIPPVSGTILLQEVDNEGNLISEFTTSNGINIINDGYVYETDIVSNNKPFFNSFEEYTSNIYSKAYKYSIVPEYSISDYIIDYVKSPSKFKATLTTDYLKLDGALKEKGFYDINESINTTNILDFDKIYDLSDNNSQLKLSFKVSGIKKFLPKRDFYPSERVLTLSKYFVDSFIKTSVDITSSYNKNDKFKYALSNGTPIDGQILTLLQPLFAPGILLNTIKSSIAVDWPVFIGNYGFFDASEKPRFYNHTGSTLIQNQVRDGSGLIEQIYNYTASNFIDTDPTFRLPFESLLQFDTIIPKNLKKDTNNIYYLNPSHYTSDVYTGEEYDEVSYPSYNMGQGSLKNSFKFLDPNYQLAMHNFLAEIPNLFLQNKLTKFSSAKTKVVANSGSVYSMNVILEKTSGYSSFIGNPYYENLKTDVDNLETNLILPPSPDSLYGPPVRYWNTMSNGSNLGSNSPYGLYSRLLDSPAYAPYVPPYFYGQSVAKITFIPDQTKEWTIPEILQKITIEYANEEAEDLFFNRSSILLKDKRSSLGLPYVNYRNSPSYKNMMALSSSVNLTLTTPVFGVEYNADNYEAGVITSQPDLNFSWVIQTKFETPSINFANSDPFNNTGFKYLGGVKQGSLVNGIYSHLFKGIWTSYGAPATEDDGIFLKIENPDDSSESLASLCGFETDIKKQIGALNDRKKIFEGVVMIPFTNKQKTISSLTEVTAETIDIIDGENASENVSVGANSKDGPFYFKIDRNILSKLLKLSMDKDSKVTYDQIKTRLESRDIDGSNSIIKLMRSMIKYVIPPHLDWLRNREIDPFVMYIFDFSVILDTEDLSNIWQGVMPKSSKKSEEQEITISHKLEKDELFHGKKPPADTRFKVFKVKQRANINYFELTENSADDSGFKFKFGNSLQSSRPEYSYNWPYDFCSIVEFINVEASVEVDKTENNTNITVPVTTIG